MANYNLSINFSPTDVQEINSANQYVTIRKEVKNELGVNGKQSVAWLTFRPFEFNLLTWETTYGVYASTTEVKSGATINKSATANPAQPRRIYNFHNGAFNLPKLSLIEDLNAYQIKNETLDPLTFGLCQGVLVNGQDYPSNPLNAVSVLAGQSANFRAIEKLTVFLTGHADNGVVLSEILGESLTLDFTEIPSRKIEYTDGIFINRGSVAANV